MLTLSWRSIKLLLLHLVGFHIYFTYIVDARSNTNQEFNLVFWTTCFGLKGHHQVESKDKRVPRYVLYKGVRGVIERLTEIGMYCGMEMNVKNISGNENLKSTAPRHRLW
jgi:hypothetical protein